MIKEVYFLPISGDRETFCKLVCVQRAQNRAANFLANKIESEVQLLAPYALCANVHTSAYSMQRIRFLNWKPATYHLFALINPDLGIYWITGSFKRVFKSNWTINIHFAR